MAIHFRFLWLTLACCILCHPHGTFARQPAEARLTEVVQNVQVSEPSASPARASVNTIMRGGSVRTGTDSRAEITFSNQTVARLGDKTDLALNSDKRTFDLVAGAVLIQVPKQARGAKIRVGPITGYVTGTTFLLERHPDAYIKFILLEGNGRLCLKKPGQISDCLVMRAGQMLIVNPSANGLPEAVDVDLDRLLKTCHLITDFPQLSRYDLLAKSAAKQRNGKSHGQFIDTNLVIYGRGTVVNLVDANGSKQEKRPADQSPTPHSSPASNTQTLP